jgi:hypothetical protein
VSVKARALDAYREYCSSGDSFTEVVERAIESAIAEEREACAFITETSSNRDEAAAAIRARGTK